MRRTLVVLACVVAILGILAPPVSAQAPAAGAPAPKVTITGLFDQVTAAGRNVYEGNYSRAGDSEWYARVRFRPDFEFAVGRTKAVFGLEIDLTYGQEGTTDGGFSSGSFASGQHTGANGGFDINTDVSGVIEVKWMYTEFDLTGKDSLLPFIPVLTVARAGGQPFGSLGNYKVVYANGDFAGFSAVTEWAPNLKSNYAFVMVENENALNKRGDPILKATRGDDYSHIVSFDLTPFKGLDIKPVYSYFRPQGTTSSSARRNIADLFITGNMTNGASAYANAADLNENRHTIGLDARWRFGPWSLDPTFYFQWGDREVQALRNGVTRVVSTDLRSWLFDVIAGWQAGPLLVEVRGMYSPGNSARDDLSRKIKYFEPLDLDTGYWAGWANIFALGVDYFQGGGGSTGFMSTNIGYDRYGRAQLAGRVTYSVTPALSFYFVGSPAWTAEKVDVDTGVALAGHRTIVQSCSTVNCSFVKGDNQFLGVETNLGMTWRFAPNVAFDVAGAYLFAGGALDTLEIQNGDRVIKDGRDAWTAAARMRLSF